jgi:hypothetical protein
MSCRERFRLKYVLGLEPHDKWVKTLGYGNMWHACEEGLAGNGDWHYKLAEHTRKLYNQYPSQRDELDKWWNVCQIQFPEYIKYWSEHPDVQNRTPLMQEQVFDVPYSLPSGRVVRLRGKFDSVDLIDGGIYLQENKSKGDIDKQQVERQLKFDLQTMLYLIALIESVFHNIPGTWMLPDPDGYKDGKPIEDGRDCWSKDYPIRGVRYNVVRRPLSGGKGSIKPHAAKYTKTTATPAESMSDYYERLRRDYIAAEPDYWFFRVRAEVSQHDIKVFRDTCLDPLLEQVCAWYDEVTGKIIDHPAYGRMYKLPPMNYRTPFGVWSALEEGGATEYDSYLETGSEAGLRRVETLFTELQ